MKAELIMIFSFFLAVIPSTIIMILGLHENEVILLVSIIGGLSIAVIMWLVAFRIWENEEEEYHQKKIEKHEQEITDMMKKEKLKEDSKK